MEHDVIDEFTHALVDPGAVVTDPELLVDSGRDFWGFGGTPGLLLRPRSNDQVLEIIHIAAERRIPVVPRGGASNCSAGMMAAQDRILLDLSGLNRILEVDVDNRRARVEPGVINAALQQRLAPHGLCFSPDPVSAPLCTIAGNISENAGGPHALKYGVTFNHILAVDIVLADGRRLTLTADDDGPDLLGVVIGSEGTLGVVTEATVALRPLAPVICSLMGGFASAHDAATAVGAILDTGVVPAALEWVDWRFVALVEQFMTTGYPTDAEAILLIDIDGSAQQVDRDMAVVERVLRRRATVIRRADNDAARKQLWHARLHGGDAVVRSGKSFLIGDVTVPRERIPEMQQAIQVAADRHQPGLSFIGVAGHAGDGNLHPVVFFDRTNPQALSAAQAANTEIIEAALSLGGTITGEHGVGTEKRQFMAQRFSVIERAAQRAIKQVFDPEGLLNPGVLLPDPTPDEPRLDAFEAAVHAALNAHCSPAIPATTHSPTAAPWARGGQGDIAIDVANLNLTVAAATTLDDLAQHLAAHNVLCSALPETHDERTIGELVATATGPERHAVRNTLLGVDVILPDHNAHAHFGSANLKDVAGYDTKRLYTGSHGNFGTITTLIFKITGRA